VTDEQLTELEKALDRYPFAAAEAVRELIATVRRERQVAAFVDALHNVAVRERDLARAQLGRLKEHV
jgi:hypothetical protein